MIKCPECGKEFSSMARSCPGCGRPICPKCGSGDVSVISNAYKALSMFAVGVYAANTMRSNYKCNKCGHKF